MPDIILRAISPETQRYQTVGDWLYDAAGNLVIMVNGTDVTTEDTAFLVALHELVEARLCFKRGVSQAAVDVFDMAFTGEGEPGDAPDAPYRLEHRFACLIEFLMAHEMGVAGYGRIE